MVYVTDESLMMDPLPPHWPVIINRLNRMINRELDSRPEKELILNRVPPYAAEFDAWIDDLLDQFRRGKILTGGTMQKARMCYAAKTEEGRAEMRRRGWSEDYIEYWRDMNPAIFMD